MKWLLIFWFFPVTFLGLWYGLSYYDMNFGIFMLRRDFHDLVFAIYGQTLHLPPESIPPLAARAIAFDTVLVFGIILWRKRKPILAWLHNRRNGAQGDAEAFVKDDNLSSAP